MTAGTFFTLLVIPSIYMLIARDQKGQIAAESQAGPLSAFPAAGHSA
jgi:hypothetical protein